jgi:hypothetical protein
MLAHGFALMRQEFGPPARSDGAITFFTALRLGLVIALYFHALVHNKVFVPPDVCGVL